MSTTMSQIDGAAIERATRELFEEGYTVVEDALPPDLLSELRQEYMREFSAKLARLRLRSVDPGPKVEANDGVRIDFRPVGGNHDVNRWNMHLPSRLPFLDPRVVAHPLVVAVVQRMLGAAPTLAIIASDVPLRGSTYQNIHQDVSAPWITLNVPLVDCTEENGALELWPRTHRNPAALDSTAPYRMTEEQIRAATRVPPKKMLLRAGSFLIRDQRLLHRGTPNRTDEPRPMFNLHYLPAPAAMPHRAVVDGVARTALAFREHVRRNAQSTDPDPRMLDAGNTLGRFAEVFSGSDRDYRRVIPTGVWSALTPEARTLLRFAEVEGESRPASAWGTALFVGHFVVDFTAFLRRRFAAQNH